MAVYFIDDRCGAIKIGCSQNPLSRLRALDTAHAIELRLLATMPGGREKETELHERFARFHIRGEWFVKTKELAEFIAEIASELDTEEILGDGPDNIRLDILWKTMRECASTRKAAMEKAAGIKSEARQKAEGLIKDAEKNMIVIKAMEKADAIIDGAEIEKVRLITEAQQEADKIVEQARLVADEYVNRKKREGISLLTDAEIKSAKKINDAKEQATRIDVAADKSASIYFGDSTSVYIFDCRCCYCGQPGPDVKPRIDDLPYCDNCWDEHTQFVQIGLRAKQIGLGLGSR